MATASIRCAEWRGHGAAPPKTIRQGLKEGERVVSVETFRHRDDDGNTWARVWIVKDPEK